MLVSLDGVTVREAEVVDDLTWLPVELAAQSTASGWLDPPTVADLIDDLPNEEQRGFDAAWERRQAVATRLGRFPDSGGGRWQVPHTYLACPPLPPGAAVSEQDQAVAAGLRSDPRWNYRELPLNHLGLLHAPEIAADALLEVTGPRH